MSTALNRFILLSCHAAVHLSIRKPCTTEFRCRSFAHRATSAAMRTTGVFERWFASTCAISLLATVMLSAAPLLHDSLHADQHGTSHQCAVTLLQSGSWDQQVAAVAAASTHLPIYLGNIVVARPVIAELHPHFARLEHAPPARA